MSIQRHVTPFLVLQGTEVLVRLIMKPDYIKALAKSSSI